MLLGSFGCSSSGSRGIGQSVIGGSASLWVGVAVEHESRTVAHKTESMTVALVYPFRARRCSRCWGASGGVAVAAASVGGAASLWVEVALEYESRTVAHKT